MSFKYFAYGSNMHLNRLRQRVGEVRVRGRAVLDGYRLAFHKKAKDGSAKCDVLRTGESVHLVHGVIYELDPAQKEVLDHYEGLGRGYEAHRLPLRTDGGTTQALAYVAHADHIDSGLVPYSWYKAFVSHGARGHGLPREYIAMIEAVPATADPDPARHAANHRVLVDPQPPALPSPLSSDFLPRR